jgi:hypothetical protein
VKYEGKKKFGRVEIKMRVQTSYRERRDEKLSGKIVCNKCIVLLWELDQIQR